MSLREARIARRDLALLAAATILACAPAPRPGGGRPDSSAGGGAGDGSVQGSFDGNGGAGGAGAGAGGGMGGFGGGLGGAGGGGGGGGGAGGGGGLGGTGGLGGGGAPSSSCTQAAKDRAVYGCLFYGYDTDNDFADDAAVFGFPIGNPGTSPVNVKVEKKVAGAWVTELAGMVLPGQIEYMRIAMAPQKGKDWHVEGSGIEDKGYRISSEAPIVVYQVNSDDEERDSWSSGSTLVLPVHALGGHYIAITPPERGASNRSLSPKEPDRAFVSVVGVTDTTRVRITVKGKTLAGGGVPALAAGDTHEVTIDEGTVFQVETAGKGNDLSGSEILSDKPVAVYAGVTCGGLDPNALGDCDHIEEAMYPVSAWGKSFVFLDMRIPNFDPSNAIWGRIVAAEDGTEITFDAPRALTGLPGAPVTLNRGQVYPLTITGPVANGRSHFSLTASKPIEVMSFMGKQEGGAVMIPVNQFLDDYLISAHPWFTGFLMVTRKAGTPVTLDGTPMAATLFTPAGAGFEVSFVGLPRCEQNLAACAHRVKGAGVGVTLTANGGVCNYCYAGGAGTRCINPGGTAGGTCD